MKKPVAEVLAIVHNNALVKVAGGMPWDDLPVEAAAARLSAMTEVVRALELLGLFVVEEGGVIRVVKAPPRVEALPSPTDTGYDTTQQAVAMGFTGIPCSRCGSPNTVRIGTCLQCHNPACMQSGECG